MKKNNKKQVAAFDQVLGHCNALGAKYNPSKDSIKVAALNSLLTSAKVSVTAAETADSIFTLAVNARQKAFEPLPGVATRVVNALIVCGSSPQNIADAKRYRDRLRSRASKTVKPEDSTKNTEQGQPADASRGPVSYFDYQSKAQTIEKILNLVKGEPLYKVNEADIAVAGLTTLLATLEAKNKAVDDAHVALRNAKISRNAALFGEEGLSGTGKLVKKYILTAFGATSEQYRVVNSISLKSK